MKKKIVNLISKTGSRDNAKSTENVLFYIKLDIWIDGSMEIVHVFFCSTYVENSGCYGNKYTEYMRNLTQKLDPVITQKY
jgi:hypothetical protein